MAEGPGGRVHKKKSLSFSLDDERATASSAANKLPRDGAQGMAQSNKTKFALRMIEVLDFFHGGR
jgi:hypothetical protein